MSTGLVSVAAALGGLAVYGGVYLGVALASRPAKVHPDPATPELGDEPPAVVSLLANRWRLTDDAAESTLLDLAARGYLELRQLGGDPYRTTVHLRREPVGAPPLLPYEQRILDRVRALAVDGMVPVTALVFRDTERVRHWTRALHREIVHDARARGLSQRRLRPVGLALLIAAAAVGAAGVTIASLLNDDTADAVKLGVGTFAILAAAAARPFGERDTPAGRRVAARWLGVREWLRAHEEFANLPPASVTVWDRYLAYGAALGVTATASAVLDLGLGDHRRVWSSYGGRWQRVRVRYPRVWLRYGQAAPWLLLRGLLAAVVGGGLLRSGNPLTLPEPTLPRDPQAVLATVADLIPWLALLLLVYGLYLCVRTVVDLATTRTVVGEVLWRQTWRRRTQGKNGPSVPHLDHLAVYDGTGDRTVAWVAPYRAIPPVRAGDVVSIRVRPWSRRVVALTLVTAGPAHDIPLSPASPAANVPAVGPLGTLLALVTAGTVPPQHGAAGQPPSEPNPAGTRPAATPEGPAALLTAEEVGQALGVPVQGPHPVRIPGLGRVAAFTTADHGHQALTVAVVGGRAGLTLWQRAQRQRPAGAPTDRTVVVDTLGAARVGDTTVLLSLPDRHRAGPEALSTLLRRAVERMPRHRDPATGVG